MRRTAALGLAVVVAFGLVTPGIASAHDRTIGTRVWMSVNDTTVERGQRVRFFGRLTSDDRRCMRDLVIRITRNDKPFARTRTNPKGRYRLTRAVERPGNYRAAFAGSRFGPTGDHEHRCAAATTDPLRIRVG